MSDPPAYYIQPTWPYFVKTLLLPNKLHYWYTVRFSDGHPDQSQREAIINCLTSNATSLAKYAHLLGAKCVIEEQVKNFMNYGFSSDKSTKALFVQYGLTGPQMIVCPGDFPIEKLGTARMVTGNPAAFKRVTFFDVPLPPHPNEIPKASGRSAADNTFPPISGVQPAGRQADSPSISVKVPVFGTPVGRQPGSQAGAAGGAPVPQQSGGNPNRRVHASAAPAGGLPARPPAQRPDPAVPSALVVTNIDNAPGTHSVCIKLIKSDIVTLAVSYHVGAVVNAANGKSFTTGDDGISGALRDAMYPQGVYEECIKFKKNRSSMSKTDQADAEYNLTILKATAESQGEYDVCGATKSQLDGSPVNRILECGAAWQYTNGYLKASGVTHVIHAVGPKWTDVDFLDVRSRSRQENTFDACSTRLDRTITNALKLAASLNVKSIAIPVISGGIFCHADEVKKRQEQQKAAGLLIAVVKELAESLPASSALETIYIVEIDPVVVRDLHGHVNNIVSEQNDKLLTHLNLMRHMVTPVPGSARGLH
jgi:O-acetyl-ADP-ribose deacetylase (regulator of RNase III)